jgi:SAM domain (Sterile alpha motif)
MAIDVASWLQQLGLAQYEPAFRDNEVDGDVLPDLTAEDLIAMGVTPSAIVASSCLPSPRSAPRRRPQP